MFVLSLLRPSAAPTTLSARSAGVTTGPVTVPFVLSIGVGFSKAAQATEGFGILTAASVAPIVSVLACSLLQKPAAAVAGLARRSLTRLLDAVFASLRGETRAASSIAAAAPSVVGSSADDRDDGETEAHV